MPSRKKRRLEGEGDDEGSLDACIADVVAEIDLEVRLRQRVQKTVESRIAWALVLQDALRKGANDATTSFEHVALDTLSAIEAPLDILFPRPVLSPPPPPAQQISRPPPRPKPPPRNPATAFLYIKSGDFDPPYGENHIKSYFLRCPECLRTTFTSLQGLFNHGNFMHSFQWGTHDECVRACAVRDPQLDTTDGIEVGLGPKGILPGLRSLFQKAVGAHPERTSRLTPDPPSPVGDTPLETSSTHLTKTLGLHEDTPALAPFLGKKAIRRGIKVYKEDEEVDVDGFGSSALSPSLQHLDESAKDEAHLGGRSFKPAWRMQYAHRNDFGASHITPGLNEGLRDPDPPPDSSLRVSNEPTVPVESQISNGVEVVGSTVSDSRFHFIARVVVLDRSLWIPPERRIDPPTAPSYKWMLSVDSPSYSHHITTVLQSIAVTDTSESFPALTASKPPFVVVGTTDEPFLARVELCFNGISESSPTQRVVLEHWVDLDPLKTGKPIIGDQQVVDIELGKGTILLPVQNGYTPLGSKSLWAEPTNAAVGRLETETPSMGYEEILEGLVDRFPLTLKDVKRNTSVPHVPYKLVANIQQFKNLVPGRRKAIEWAKARAIQAAYTKILNNQPPSDSSISLSTADVYTWLVDRGHFIMRRAPPPEPKKEEKEEAISNTSIKKEGVIWCVYCGQKREPTMAAIANVKTEDKPKLILRLPPDSSTLATEGASPLRCACPAPPARQNRIVKMPIVDAHARLRHLNANVEQKPFIIAPSAPSHSLLKKYTNANIIQAAHPQMTMGVHTVISRLSLPAFTSPHSEKSRFPLEQMGSTKSSIEAHLAPHAILSIAAQSFLRVLVKGGLEQCLKDANSVAPGRRKKRKKGASNDDKGNFTSVLTPAHVLRGMVARGQAATGGSARAGDGGVERMVYELLVRLGTHVGSGGGEVGRAESTGVSIKVEEL